MDLGISIIMVIAVFGLFHSLLASLRAKAEARRLFGEAGARFYRLFYNLFAVISFLPVLALFLALPDRVLYAIPFPWTVITLIIQFLSLLALFLAIRQTGFWSFIGVSQLVEPGETKPTLIVDGLYRWVRHPLYTAGLLFIWLAPLMTRNLLLMNFGLTVYLIIGTMLEERKLLREFESEYESYRRTTPMFIPGFRPLHWPRPKTGTE